MTACAAMIYRRSTAEADRRIADMMNGKVSEVRPDDDGSPGVLTRIG
ncbi:hypothetical protein AB0D67_16845 [Streptosporangium sp. NPDC048047]